MVKRYYLNYLDELESEAIYILREAWSQFKNPVILFSGGKDSAVVIHLAQKAFYPLRIPFPLLHVDTGHNFPETIDFRNELVHEVGAKLIIASVQESIDNGRVTEEKGTGGYRNLLQINTLLDVIKDQSIDCAVGGARRDEEKSRAKERIFSHRDIFGQWNPKSQRPELWQLFNCKHNKGEHFRAFPVSNWTELDIWNYIKRENIKIPLLYFAHKREVVWKNETWIPYSKFLYEYKKQKIVVKRVRFRTLGDITTTGGIESDADNIDEIIKEIAVAKVSERGNRSDDKLSCTAMEERKLKGYF